MERNSTEPIQRELTQLAREGLELFKVLAQNEHSLEFRLAYQAWYSKAIRSLAVLAPDRLSEFRSYYEIDPKRKSLGYGTYVIQDWFKGVAPSRVHYPDFDSVAQVKAGILNQYTILNGVSVRAESILANIEGELFGELEDNELEAARALLSVSIRAAGVLAGVLLETHLAYVCRSHAISFRKKNPTIGDFSGALKDANSLSLPDWRKISYLADIRNMCAHKKEKDPSRDQVVELIDGVHWATKNVF